MSNIPKHLLNSKLITNDQWDEYQDLKEKIKMYEDPDDLTLFYMWLDERAKDKLKKLEEENMRLRIEVSAREEEYNILKERIVIFYNKLKGEEDEKNRNNRR